LNVVLSRFDGKFDQLLVVDETGDPLVPVVAQYYGAEYVRLDASGAGTLWTEVLARIANSWAVWLDTGDRFLPTEVDRLRDWLSEAATPDACLCHVRSVDDSWGRGSHCLQLRVFRYDPTMRVVCEDLEEGLFRAYVDAKAKVVVAPIEFTCFYDHVVYDTSRLHERNAAFLRSRVDVDSSDVEARRHLLVQLLLAHRFEEMEDLLGPEPGELGAQDVDDPMMWRALMAIARSDMATARRYALFAVRRRPKSGIAHLLLAMAQLNASDVKTLAAYLERGTVYDVSSLISPLPMTQVEFERARLTAIYLHYEASTRLQTATQVLVDRNVHPDALWTEAPDPTWQMGVAQGALFCERAVDAYWWAVYIEPQRVDLMTAIAELETALIPLLPSNTTRTMTQVQMGIAAYVAGLNTWRECQERIERHLIPRGTAFYDEGTFAELEPTKRDALIRRIYAGYIRVLLSDDWRDSVQPRRVITTAMEAFPKEAQFVLDNAQWLFKTGDTSNAVREVRRAITLEPQSFAVMERAIRLLSTNGQSATAEVLNRRAWELHPGRYDTALSGVALALSMNNRRAAQGYLIEIRRRLADTGLADASSWSDDWSADHPVLALFSEPSEWTPFAPEMASDPSVVDKTRRLAQLLRTTLAGRSVPGM
jgi:Flp pilus assembly protein TadD